jgi:acetyl esterase/lipase
MLLHYCYNHISFLPVLILQYINYFYSLFTLWSYQCYIQMLTCERFNGLLIRKGPRTAVLYVHSGFAGISTAANDLRFNLNLAYRTDCTVLSVDYDNSCMEQAISDVHGAYDWLVEENYQRIVVMGAGIGCYIIQALLSSEKFRKKKPTDVIFLSPVSKLRINEHSCNSDYLSYGAVRRALDTYKDSCCKVDYKRFWNNANRFMVVYGEKEAFCSSAERVVKKLSHFGRSKLTVVSSYVGQHCFLLHDCEHFDKCYSKLRQFVVGKRVRC